MEVTQLKSLPSWGILPVSEEKWSTGVGAQYFCLGKGARRTLLKDQVSKLSIPRAHSLVPQRLRPKGMEKPPIHIPEMFTRENTRRVVSY